MAFSLNLRNKKPAQVTVRRKKKKKGKQNKVGRSAFAVLVIAAALALIFFLVMRSSSRISMLENAVGTILSPISGAFSGPTIFLRDTVNGAKDYLRITEDLEKSRREIMEVRLQLQEYEQAMQENERLRTLLDTRDRYGELDPVHARVIMRNPGIWFDTFSINVGTAQGIKVDHAVINADGLVGRVFEVGTNYAKVMTIINEESAVGVLVERSREDCMMYGRISQESELIECTVGRLRQINAVMPGDVLVTSGSDRVYPKGLKVAAITQVSRQQSSASDRFVYAQPLVDFLRIEDVLVLRVEAQRDDVGTAPLPQETPKPTPMMSTTPAPSQTPGAAPGTMESEFFWPEGVLTEDGELIETQPDNNRLLDGANENNMLIEDEWAR